MINDSKYTLDDILPKGENWTIRDGVIYFRKIHHIPLLYQDDENIYHIILDNRLQKEVIRLVEICIKLDLEFYMTVPGVLSPKYRVDMDTHYDNIIYNYLYCYIEFIDKLKNSKFDLIDNLIDFVIKYNCYENIDYNYDRVMQESIKLSYLDIYSGKVITHYKEEDIHNYESLGRGIRLRMLMKSVISVK